jgi:hypothetical protein
MSELFFEPKTSQYGSHMVMSNVNKISKKKFINIDTKFRDEYNYSQLANYNITLPERINDVKDMKIVCAEIPMTFYNISAALGNNSFYISDSNGFKSTISVPDGNYAATDLLTAINTALTTATSIFDNGSGNTTYTCNVSGNNSSFSFQNVNNTTISINFAVDSNGNIDKFNFKTKLGWLLGFRNPTYSIIVIGGAADPITLKSEAFIDIHGPKYLYLAIDEFNNKGNQSSFVPPLFNSLVNKNIIARITMEKTQFNFGSILPANNLNSLLITDHRSYTGKIDLMKLNVQLLTENGLPVNLNGMDFSFCMEVTHE